MLMSFQADKFVGVGGWGSFAAIAGLIVSIALLFVAVFRQNVHKVILIATIDMVTGFGFFVVSTFSEIPFYRTGTCIAALVFIGLVFYIIIEGALSRWIPRDAQHKPLVYASLSGALIVVIVAMSLFHMDFVNSYCCGSNNDMEETVEEESEQEEKEDTEIETSPEEQIAVLLQDFQTKIDEAKNAEKYDHTSAEAKQMYEDIFENFHTERYKTIYKYDGFYVNRTFYVIIPAVVGEAEDILSDGTYWKAKHYQYHHDETEDDKVMWRVCVRAVDGKWLINSWVKPPKEECP